MQSSGRRVHALVGDLDVEKYCNDDKGALQDELRKNADAYDSESRLKALIDLAALRPYPVSRGQPETVQCPNTVIMMAQAAKL